MMCGPEPGSGKSEITWTKIPSTTLARMEDDSLIHLFTRKKSLKKRTKLLNSHLREHAHHTISYPDYIKVKTAVLRTLSDDEETSDDSVVSDDHDFEKPHVHSDNPKTSALRTLLKDMMLDSQSSSEEFQEKIPKPKKLGKKTQQKNTKFSASNSENNKTPVIVKRPRGRPRKYPLTPSNSATNIDSSQQELESKSLVEENDSTSDIVTIIIDNHENSNASNISNSRDPLAHNSTPIRITPEKMSHHNHIYEKISKMIADGVEPQIAADASKIYSTTDDSEKEEFLSPQTTDYDYSSDEECSSKNVPRENGHVSGGNLLDDHDDMFEEEKIITQEELIIGNYEENRLDCDEDSKKMGKIKNNDRVLINEFSQESIVQNSQLSELSEYGEEKEKNKIDNLEEESIVFTQEFDANNHDNVNNIEDYVEQVVKQFDEKFSDNLKEKLLKSRKKLLITPEKFNEHGEDHEAVHELKKSTEKTKINSKVSEKISQSSPKTPADVKRNLMASLNGLNIEKSIANDRVSSLDGEDSRPDDLCSLPPPDSGIDEDSETILPQESPKFIGNDLKKIDNHVQKIEKKISPSKKLPNLIITCTEVVKSKYMIIKNGQEDKSPIKSLPQEIETSKSLNESENEENNDFSLHYSDHGDDDHYNNILSFKEQLNNYDSDCDDNYEENARKKLKRNPISLTIPSESESLKYVLNSLSGREHYVRNLYEDDSDALQRELLMGKNSESDDDSENERKTREILPRPMNIQEFIEGGDFIPLDVHPSFTLADIGDDEDIYLMEIPKTILEQDLEGQIFKLTERRIIIGNGRYNIQKKEGRAISCILHCGDYRNIYKTGIIEPIEHIVVEQKVRDDVIETSKVKLESSMTVPFPKNIKSRYPPVQIETDEHDVGQAVGTIDTKKRKLSESDEIYGHQEFKKRRIFIGEEEENDELIQHNFNHDFEYLNNEETQEEFIDEACRKIKKKKKSKTREISVEKQEDNQHLAKHEDCHDIHQNNTQENVNEGEEINQEFEDQLNNEKYETVEKKKKRKSKERRKLFYEGKSLIDIQNNSVLDMKEAEDEVEQYLNINEHSAIEKKNKKYKKYKKLKSEKRESSFFYVL